MKDSDYERIKRVVDDLSGLILYHSGMTAQEQYCPRMNADESDDYIKAHIEWVNELRSIRHRFENLVTGVLDTNSNT